MKKNLIIGALVLAAFGAQAGAAGAATLPCISNMLSGLGAFGGACPGYNTRVLKMVRHRFDNSWVSYTSDYLYQGTGGTYAYAVESAANTQFSDRTYTNQNGAAQNFSVSAQDKVGIQILNNNTVKITEDSWGHGVTTLTSVSCSGEMITATSSSTMYLFTYGPLMNIDPC